MWIEDIKKVLDYLAEKYGAYSFCIDKIEHNFIYLSSGDRIPFKDIM